jgi:hypothetical protein
MGGVKRMLEERETQRAVAIRISLDAGALQECEFRAEPVTAVSRQSLAFEV